MIFTQKANHRIKRILLYLLILVPPLILGWLIWRYGVNLPYWDQWDTPGRLIVEATHASLSQEQWMRQHNESRTLFPNLVFLSLANLTNWNNRYEMLVTFILACLVAYNIYRLSRITLDRDWQHLICFLLASLLIFSPTQHENWLWGFQGVAFITIAAITTSLVVIFSATPWIAKLIVSCLLSAIATFSFANGVLCWLLIIPALLLKAVEDKFKKIWVIFWWLIASSFTLTIYLYDYQRGASSASLTQVFTQPKLAISYYFALLGSPIFPYDLLASQITGLAIAFIFVACCFYLLIKRRNILTINRSLPWILLGCYTLLSAGLTTAGRIHFGIETALSSRYISFAIYLTIAIIYLFAIILKTNANRVWLKIIVSLLTALLIVTCRNNFLLGIESMTRSHYQRVYGKTCLMTMDLINDTECISLYVHPVIEHIETRVRRLDEVGLLQPGFIDNINWQKSTQNSPNQYGEFNNFLHNQDGSYLASGWTYATTPEMSFDAVILAYQTDSQPRKAFAIAQLQPEEKDILKLSVNPQNTKLTWNETIAKGVIPQQAEITAWVFNTNNAEAYPLQSFVSQVISKSIAIDRF